MKKRTTLIVTSIVSFSLAMVLSTSVRSQIHSPFLSQNNWVGLAAEQNEQELYRAAYFSSGQHLLQTNSRFLNTDPIIQKDKARYLNTLAQLKLQKAAISDYFANPAYRERIGFAYAQYYFQKAAWTEVIEHTQNSNIANLTNAEVALSKFQLAYSYFNNKQFKEAETLFLIIKDIDGAYSASAQYYYGLLAYNEGNYKEALKSFEKIEQLNQYQTVVPYYIAEILYFSGNRDKALQKTKTLIAQKEKSYYDNELHLLAAQCLFEEQKYKEALPYFESYYQKVDKIRKQDVYKMGYSYHETEQWKKAIEPFQQLSVVQDSLGQMAMYLLGDCYLKMADLKGAKNSFSICSQMPFNKNLVEPALLLSGKLSFELGYSSEGCEQLKKLLKEYPSSEYKTEAEHILSEQLLKTNNYSEAYQMLSNNASPPHILMQKCAYGYALQNMQQKNWTEAVNLLNVSLQHNESLAYEAAAYFWKAEIDYSDKNYTAAIEDGNLFLTKNNHEVTAICANANPQNALLTMGYAALNANQFEQARTYFAQSQSQKTLGSFSSKLAADAALREADATFLQKDYAKAAELYNKTIAQNSNDADYAKFQKSTVLGLQGKSAEQAELLLEMVAQKNPESKYKYEAHYALGDLHLDANKFEDAISHFQKINDKTAKHLAAKALMKIAFTYQEADNNEKAIENYKKVVLNYPSGDQKFAALDALKNLYIGANQPKAYVQLLQDNHIAISDNQELDSLFYAAAEAQFSATQYSKARNAMRDYLFQFPEGIFKTKAFYYKAESHAQLKEYDSAIYCFDKALGGIWTDFTEVSAKKAASLSYNQNNFKAANQYYAVLRNNAIAKDNLKEAYKGLMLSAFKLNMVEASARYADTLLIIPDIDEQTKEDALLVKGNADLTAQKYEDANQYYAQLIASKNIEIAAEANYAQARILLLEGKIEAAEKSCVNAIQKTTASNFWNTKSYLLMADIFIQQKDYFNAKATLQSIVKNVKIESLKKEASATLEQVKVLEKNKSKLSEG
ncbi:MAG: tetratricopeptide repeat protein [Phycisphaerales bacterium]|nr:tetratricopeptide repeat protein [Phycisphaerales bacterium]